MHIHIIAPQPDSYAEYNPVAAATAGVSRMTRVASAAIVTVAAMVPADFRVTVCDEAVQDIDLDVDADCIAISVNVSQAIRALALAAIFRAKGRLVILGGPHVSLAPELFDGKANALVVGELESVAKALFDDLRDGSLKPRYDGSRVDMSLSPAPRWDLYPNERAWSGVLQTSRGCPFECTFCDVIQYLGRVQRHKPDAQVIVEAQALYDHGYGTIVLADDNFTVYRQRARTLLKALAAWNGKEGRDYVVFATQISIDAARDRDLLALCHDAGVLKVFIGIESGSAAGLLESKKRQNLKVDLAEQCAHVVRAGLQIDPGLIVGFDSDDTSCFTQQFDFAMTLPATIFGVSVLVAPVATPLYERMQMEGRIDTSDMSTQFPSANLVSNFLPAQMSRADLTAGAQWLICRLMRPEHVIERLDAIVRLLPPPPWSAQGRRRPARPAVARAMMVTMRKVMQANSATARVVQHVRSLSLRYPDSREALTDMLVNYIMLLGSYMDTGIYDPALAQRPEPVLGRDQVATPWIGATQRPAVA